MHLSYWTERNGHATTTTTKARKHERLHAADFEAALRNVGVYWIGRAEQNGRTEQNIKTDR